MKMEFDPEKIGLILPLIAFLVAIAWGLCMGQFDSWRGYAFWSLIACVIYGIGWVVSL
jgi:hypothetical protein